LNKKIVATDYKIRKDWSTAMQQFSLSTDDTAIATTYGETKKDTPIAPTRSHTFQVPTWLPRTIMFTACALIVGNIPLQSSHKAFELDHTDSMTTSAPQQIDTVASITETNIVENQQADQKTLPEGHKRTTLTEKLTLPQAPILVLSVTESTSPKTFIDDNWTTHTLSSEKTAKDLFTKIGIKSECDSMAASSKKIKENLNSLSKNDIVRIEKIDGELTQLVTYKRGSRKSFVISKRGDRYTSRLTSRVIETRQARKTLFIKNSLRYDSNQENISQKLVKQFIKIFDRDLKLASDLRKGDRVTLVFEELFHKGNKIGSSEILAAELIHNKRSHRAIRYVQSDNSIKYLDANGRDLDQAFKRHALKNYKRISSHFGSRHHPLYKRLKDHHGTDYVALRGTPITATGNGIITHVARKGGYGKTVEIKHRDGYVTRYAHMSNYAKGMKTGQKVYLGDTIGYVGSTGSSTGDHLHYEFRLNGVPLNPETVQLPKSLSLTMEEQKQFKQKARGLIKQLDVLQRFAQEKVDISSGFGG
jgi:murein DD-endopeptidase MepM/ murein hydrolase activator NlpD